MTKITKESLLKIIESADEVLTALAGTNDDVHPESDNMLRLWDDLNDRYAPPEVVREMARMLLAAQAHITELEMAPPAPVGPGEEPVPVMPDFPGRVMTQRECWAAGKAAGIAEAGNSPVIPDGYALAPFEPTAEMISSGIAAHFERSQTQIHDRPAPGPMECAYVAMLAAAPQQESSNG